MSSLQRRKPLKATKGLERRTGLARASELTCGGELNRTGRLRPRSKKTEKRYRVRRMLVAELLEQRPWCEIRWDDRCQGRAVDVDEVLSRGRGGDYCDPDNVQTACRACHSAKHENPLAAVARDVARDVARNSWERGAA